MNFSCYLIAIRLKAYTCGISNVTVISINNEKDKETLVGEREMPLKHIKSLKRLAAWVCVDEFHLFADFFARNDFSLEKLSVTGNGFLSHHNYNNISVCQNVLKQLGCSKQTRVAGWAGRAEDATCR